MKFSEKFVVAKKKKGGWGGRIAVKLVNAFNPLSVRCASISERDIMKGDDSLL